MSNFFSRIIRKPPVFFPLVALFHIVMLLAAIWLFGSQGDLQSREGLTTTLVWLVYGILWLFICDMKKWAAIAYVICSLAGLCFQFLLPKGSIWYDIGTVIFPFDLLMIVFLMFYYNRFE